MPDDFGINRILRKLGFVRLPPLWVKPEDMNEIHKIAHRYQDVVNTVRAGARREAQKQSDPILNKDAAWEAFKASKEF